MKKNLDDSSETSYLLCITSRKLLEELTKLPVMFVLSSDFFDRNTLVFVADSPKTWVNDFSKNEKNGCELS